MNISTTHLFIFAFLALGLYFFVPEEETKWNWNAINVSSDTIAKSKFTLKLK
jgi:hypothetical protein